MSDRLGKVLQSRYRIRLIDGDRRVAISLKPAPNAKGIGWQAPASYLPKPHRCLPPAPKAPLPLADVINPIGHPC
jgi:hypothetical protein